MERANIVVSSYAYSKRKRLFDLFLSFVLLLSLVILIPIIWVLMLLVDKGPLIFSQTRIGYEGKEFILIKIRSMRRGFECDSINQKEISRLGSLIRKLHIDEFPQAFNIIKGEMSFVGPRPYVIEECESNSLKLERFHLRALVKPGITGLAQIEYQHENIEQAARKLELDLHYISTCSLRMDAHILFSTFLDSVMGRGE